MKKKLKSDSPLRAATCCALWESIETAPKNGTEILVWREDSGTLLARWIAPIDFLAEAEIAMFEGSDIEDEDWFYADFVAGGRLDDPPTHWTPLPSRHNVNVDATADDKTQPKKTYV